MYQINPFSFSYKKNDNQKALFFKEKIDIKKGEFIAITGPSGSGKSTLLKLLKGIIPEHISGHLEGNILFDGEILHSTQFEKNLKRILYLFQNPFTQTFHPSPEEEFLFSLENFNYSLDEIKKRGEKLEKIFDLKNLWGKQTKDLSHGECQKLVLASLMAVDPEVLLLDEPTAFLDPKARREFYQFLELMKKNHTIILIDHHLNEIKSLVDRYIWIDESGEMKVVVSPVEKKEELISRTNQEKKSDEKIVLKVSELNFSYDKKKLILENISLEAKGGDVLAITGNNGAGKSTLLKLLCGLLKPSTGKFELEINDKKIKHAQIHDFVGMVFQNPETHFFYDTVSQELNQSFKRNSPDLSFVKNFLNEIDLQKSPFLLSEGEKRRLSILMTIYLGKKVIFYDEPTFGQDKKAGMAISALMKSIQHQGLLQIMISHDEDFIKDNATVVYHLNQGKLNVVS